MHKVYEERENENTLVFQGSQIDAREVFDVLKEYHKYDYFVGLRLEEPKVYTPKYESLDKFYKVHEYKHTLGEMNKDKKYKADSSDLGVKYFDTIDECWEFLGKGHIGSSTGIFYADTGAYVESEVPF